MVTIFHGDNPSQSRQAFSEFISQFVSYDQLHLDSKTIDLNQINNFLHGGSLLPGHKLIIFDNFFSISKPNLDKILKYTSNSDAEIAIWQDKTLNATQLKMLPGAKVTCFRTDNRLYACLNAIKPHHLSAFNNLYDIVVNQDLFDLFLYLLKANLRRQLQDNVRSNLDIIKRIYLQIVELEFQYKSGQLVLPKEIALKRVLIPLLK
jgi:hypothetical protein